METLAIRKRPSGIRQENSFRGYQASAIFGPVGYIGHASADRVKGFLPFRINSEEKVSEIYSIVEYSCDSIDRQSFSSGDGLFLGKSRFSLRFVLDNEYKWNLNERLNQIGADVEALLRLDERSSVAYVGYNRREREGYDCRTQIRLRNMLEQIYGGDFRIGKFYDKERLVDVSNNYGMPVVFRGSESESRLGREGLAELAQLICKTYDYDLGSVHDILINKENIISVIPYTYPRRGKIAAAGVVECVRVNLEGREIGFAELTDTIVRRKDREEGMALSLGFALSSEVVRYLSSMQRKPDVIFSESSLEDPSILISSYMQRRIPSGYLHSHTKIEETFTDLVVMQISEDSFRSIARK